MNQMQSRFVPWITLIRIHHIDQRIVSVTRSAAVPRFDKLIIDVNETESASAVSLIIICLLLCNKRRFRRECKVALSPT